MNDVVLHDSNQLKAPLICSEADFLNANIDELDNDLYTSYFNMEYSNEFKDIFLLLERSLPESDAFLLASMKDDLKKLSIMMLHQTSSGRLRAKRYRHAIGLIESIRSIEQQAEYDSSVSDEDSSVSETSESPGNFSLSGINLSSSEAIFLAGMVSAFLFLNLFIR